MYFQTLPYQDELKLSYWLRSEDGMTMIIRCLQIYLRALSYQDGLKLSYLLKFEDGVAMMLGWTYRNFLSYWHKSKPPFLLSEKEVKFGKRMEMVRGYITRDNTHMNVNLEKTQSGSDDRGETWVFLIVSHSSLVLIKQTMDENDGQHSSEAS